MKKNLTEVVPVLCQNTWAIISGLAIVDRSIMSSHPDQATIDFSRHGPVNTMANPDSNNVKQLIVSALTDMGVNTMSGDIKDIKTMMVTIQQKQTDLETAVVSIEKDQGDAKDQIKALQSQNTSLQKRLEFSENRITDIENKYIKLETRTEDTQYHTMKNNLVFYNIPEGDKENTRLIMMNFLRVHMKINDRFFLVDQLDTSQPPNTIWIDRCHRFGTSGTDNPRPIVAVCTLGRDIIMNHAKYLAKTKYFVAQQLPPKMNEVKRQMSAMYRQAKDQGKRASFLGKGDAIAVDGTVYRAPCPPKLTTAAPELLERRETLSVLGSDH